MANTMKQVRITKAQRFEDIIALVNGDSVKYGTTAEDAVAVLNHEIELLAKKNAGDSKKQTIVQKENEGYKALIVEFLSTVSDPNGVTCSTIQKSIPDFADFNNQKVSALLRQLVTATKVAKSEVKGKTMFRLA